MRLHCVVWWDKVLAWEQDPRLLIPQYLTLPHEQKDLVFLFIQSLSHVFQKHLTLNITDEEGTLQTTNRWGETVFRHLRMVFERQQKTRTLIIAALVVAKRSSFRQDVIANPMEIREAMPQVRKRLDNPKTTTTRYYIERFHNLLEEGKQTEARKQANARFNVLLGRLQEHGLVEGNPSNLTVDVLKQATHALKHKSPVLDDILRLGGNKEQLVTQLEQWLE